ncbi:zeatin O-glucosyltransferase-like [Senna tora]|uniref:Glycosyltransferase n=1 Tax=Senna tora TaxID=362788 RepID=A0A834VZM3_9FABA|nr:zeatin O-glucosyltransferase-like [Senna tora]
MASSLQSSPPSSKNTYQSHKNHMMKTEQGFHHHHHHQNQVIVVIVPFPAQGHLNQLLHLSRLILSYNIPVHYVGTTSHNLQATLRVQASWLHLRHPVASLLHSLSSSARRLIVIHDSLMASVVQDASGIPNAETYTFHSVSAFTMFLFFWEAMGRTSIPIPNHTHLPKQVPSLENCFPPQFLDLISAQYEFNKSSKGTLYNTSRAIERPYMELIERIHCGKKHWALGPFNPLEVVQNKSSLESSSSIIRRHFSLEWLDEQEENSVMYVSFGTTTTLTEEQIKEIAIGLEESKQKFIWVLRNADKGNIFNSNEEEEEGVGTEQILPKGFEERVKLRGIGLIVREWAPQLEILRHSSTGGFMSHCGWNSCMESITMGVPIAAWPMHSDQPRNRVLITEVLQVGLMVKDEEELVRASMVENGVRRLMATKEGDEMRRKAMKLRSVVQESLDEGGVSRLEMDSFIAHITRL